MSDPTEPEGDPLDDFVPEPHHQQCFLVKLIAATNQSHPLVDHVDQCAIAAIVWAEDGSAAISATRDFVACCGFDVQAMQPHQPAPIPRATIAQLDPTLRAKVEYARWSKVHLTVSPMVEDENSS